MTSQISVDEFLALIERSGLLTADKLASYAQRARSGEPLLASVDGLARQLVRDRLLTPFQAKQLLRGRFRGFFLNEKYKVLELLGEGGMGRVLLCEHLMLHKLMAVKLLQVASGSMAGAAERFHREARASAGLDHPNIVRVFDVDKVGTIPFMVMEYVDGLNLHQIVVEHGALAINRAAEYARQAAHGLQCAHEGGLVHRDIKPGNLLLDRNGVVKLLDLGLARFFDAGKNDNLTQKFDEKSILGTADFIAPEQAMNSSRVDIRADIYSLGCTLYFLLLRRFPFDEGSATQKLIWHQTREPQPVNELRSDVPVELAAVVHKMMQKKPEDRFQTPAEVAAALQPFCQNVSPPTTEEMPKVRPAMYLIGLCKPPSGSFFATPSTTAPNTGNPDTATVSTRGSTAEVNLATSAAPSYPQVGTPRSMPRTSELNPQQPGNLYPSGMMQPSSTMSGAMPAEQSKSLWMIALAGLAGLAIAVGGGLAAMSLSGMFKDSGNVAQVQVQNQTPSPTKSTTEPPPPTKSDILPIPTPTPTPTPSSGILIQGAGSTFVQPLMTYWAPLYEKRTGVRIEYSGGGSGAGVEAMSKRFRDFGCSDAPMTDAQLTAAKETHGEVIHVPLAMGAVVPVYNLPTVSQPLKLTGGVLADIYLGKIKTWNAPPIALNNPGVILPELAITVIRRSDKSGTTFIWTDYLSKVNSEWKKEVGASTEVKWPLGEGFKGNDGVADAVNRQEGAIGYVELTYALANSLSFAHVKNRSGVVIAPSLASVTAAAAGALQTIPDDLRYTLTDAPGQSSYPICGTVWAVVYTDQPAEKGKPLAEFLWWATHDGQALVKDLKYAPLPAELVQRVEDKLSRIAGAGRRGK